MKVKSETIYTTSDGAKFSDLEAAEEHEAMLEAFAEFAVKEDIPHGNSLTRTRNIVFAWEQFMSERIKAQEEADEAEEPDLIDGEAEKLDADDQ